jgi:ABC-type amino acid transport substrate-binding protein
VSRRGALRALVGGIGLVAGVVGGTVVAAVVLVALGLPAPGRADDGGATTAVAVARPTELVIGLVLRDPRLQAGVVRDGAVVLARGLEVDVARALAHRLRVRSIRFVDLEHGSGVPSAIGAEWQVAVTEVRPTRRLGAAGAALSVAYLPTGPVVVQRRGQRPVRSLGELRRMRLCATRGTDSSKTLADLDGLARPPMRPDADTRLAQLVQTGACDAALVDGVEVGTFVAGRRGLFGPIAARIDHGEGLAVVVAGESGLGVAEVNRALRRLRADGTVSRLARQWLVLDPSGLRALR